MCRGLDAVLRSHRIGNPSAVPAPPTQPDLLTTSSAHFAGGAATARALEESVGELNFTGHTANNLVMLVQNAKSKNDSRREHMAEDAAMENWLTPEELQKRYIILGGVSRCCESITSNISLSNLRY